MVEDLTLNNKDESNFSNDLQKNTNQFDFISLHNLTTNNYKQSKTYETNSTLLLTEKNKSFFILHINVRSIYKNLDALNHELLPNLDYLPELFV